MYMYKLRLERDNFKLINDNHWLNFTNFMINQQNNTSFDEFQ